MSTEELYIGDTVIIENESGFFGARKEDVIPKPSSRLTTPNEWIYSADKYTAVIHGNKIHIIALDDPFIRVTIERRRQRNE